MEHFAFYACIVGVFEDNASICLQNVHFGA
jgi:hypothetical protein